MHVDSLTPEVDPKAISNILYKPEENSRHHGCAPDILGQGLSGWAQYPILETGKPCLIPPATASASTICVLDTRVPGSRTLSFEVDLDSQLREFPENGSKPGAK